MDKIAAQIINLRDLELNKQSNFRILWQKTADLMYPREDQISGQSTPGEDRTTKLYDSTAVFDSQDMTSGLSAALFPTGQKFFGYRVDNRQLNEMGHIRRYLGYATEIVHEALFASNFMLHINESIRSLVVFGTCNLFSEWDTKRGGLNFKDHAISIYQIKEDSAGNVDTVILSFSLTARQAAQKFGDKCSEEIQKNAAELADESKKHEFIHIVRPRTSRNPLYKDNRNMPYESIVVEVKVAEIVQESGFEELPFAVARWMKSSTEKYGRGQGTECLADVRMLQKMKKDYIDLCNRYANPPLEVLENVDGDVDMRPLAVNRVQQLDSIRGINQTVLGNFPVTEKAIETQQEAIHRAFYRDVFVQMSDLTNRRTAFEIEQRIQEGLRRMASPVARLQSELLSPVLMRCLLLLIRNGRIEYPPPELQGQGFGIIYTGRLALALQNQQSTGFVQWVQTAGPMEQVSPGVLDNVNFDRGVRQLGEDLGVNISAIATDEEVAAKREARQQQLIEQQAAQAAEVASNAYSKTSKKPEEGSAAEQVMAGMENQ